MATTSQEFIAHGAPAFEEVVLRKVLVKAAELVRPVVLHDPRVNLVADHCSDAFVAHLSDFVWAEEREANTIEVTVEAKVTVPADWREAVKEAVYRRWPWVEAFFGEAYPVLYRTYRSTKTQEAKIETYYPQFEAKVPGQRYVTRFHREEEHLKEDSELHHIPGMVLERMQDDRVRLRDAWSRR